jgi:hypothetical protein
MTSQQRWITPSNAESVQAKLQALYDSMPPDEQGVLETILKMAAQPTDVTGFTTDIETPFTFRLITNQAGGYYTIHISSLSTLTNDGTGGIQPVLPHGPGTT